jgi:hypothetical protein
MGRRRKRRRKTLAESVRARIGAKAWRRMPRERRDAIRELSKIREMGKIGSGVITRKEKTDV